MGVNTVQIIGAGLHTYTIPEADRIRVNTSNFIGIHFPDPGVSGLVSYSADTSHYCFNTNVRHGAIQNNGRLLDNTVYGNYEYFHRTASIRARVDSGKLNIMGSFYVAQLKIHKEFHKHLLNILLILIAMNSHLFKQMLSL